MNTQYKTITNEKNNLEVVYTQRDRMYLVFNSINLISYLHQEIQHRISDVNNLMMNLKGLVDVQIYTNNKFDEYFNIGSLDLSKVSTLDRYDSLFHLFNEIHDIQKTEYSDLLNDIHDNVLFQLVHYVNVNIVNNIDFLSYIEDLVSYLRQQNEIDIILGDGTVYYKKYNISSESHDMNKSSLPHLNISIGVSNIFEVRLENGECRLYGYVMLDKVHSFRDYTHLVNKKYMVI